MRLNDYEPFLKEGGTPVVKPAEKIRPGTKEFVEMLKSKPRRAKPGVIEGGPIPFRWAEDDHRRRMMSSEARKRFLGASDDVD